MAAVNGLEGLNDRFDVIVVAGGYAVIDRVDNNRLVFETRHRKEADTRCSNLNSQNHETVRHSGTAAPKAGKARKGRRDETEGTVE